MDYQSILNKIRDFQRPVRMCVWVLCIATSYMIAVISKTTIIANEALTQTILYGMFADLGIYGIARTYEKVTQAKTIAGNPTTVNINKTTVTDESTTVN